MKAKYWFTPLLLAIILSASVLLYFYAYRMTGMRIVIDERESQTYGHRWQAILFTPAVKWESVRKKQAIDIGWLEAPPNEE